MGMTTSTVVNPGEIPAYVQKIQQCGCDRPNFNAPKPDELNVSPATWEALRSRVAPLADKLTEPQRLSMVLVPVVVILMLVGVAASSPGAERDEDTPAIMSFLPQLLGLAAVAMFIGAVFVVTSKNQEIDAQITAVVRELTESFHAEGYSISYRTQWTGACKPKHAKPERVIVFSARTAPQTAAPPGTQMVMVTVPAGVGPGMPVNFVAPNGQTMQVAVPPGVAPGQQFQVAAPTAPAGGVGVAVAPQAAPQFQAAPIPQSQIPPPESGYSPYGPGMVAPATVKP